MTCPSGASSWIPATRPEIRPAIAIFALLLLLPGSALAQFELDPPKGYDTTEPAAADCNLREYAPSSDVGENHDELPDFCFQYQYGAQRQLSWASDGPGNAELAFLDPHGAPLICGNPAIAIEPWGRIISIFGLNGNRIETTFYGLHGEEYRRESVEFPPLSAEYVWLVDLTGDGRSEIVISGMTGISNGGGAYVFRMTDEQLLEPVMESYGEEAFPQQLWSFYGDMELLRTPEGKWVFKGISPVGRNLTEYFWSWFYEWDEEQGMFVMDGPSFQAEKDFQYGFFRRFHRMLKDFLVDPDSFLMGDPSLDYRYGFSDDYGDYSLDCFLEEDGTPMTWLVEETIVELDYMLADPVDGSDEIR